MSTTEAAIWTAVIVLLFLLLLAFALCRAAGRVSRMEEEQAARGDCEPDTQRFLEDLEARLKAYGKTVADYYDTTTGGPHS